MRAWYEVEALVLLESRQTCRSCNEDTPVFALGAESVRDPGGDHVWEDIVFDFVDAVSEEAMPVIERLSGGRFRGDASDTAGGSYLMNHCACCGAKQGDFYMRESGAAFAPFSRQQAAPLRHHALGIPARVKADWLTIMDPGPFDWLRGTVALGGDCAVLMARTPRVNVPEEPTEHPDEDTTMSNTNGPSGYEPRNPGLGALFSRFSDDNPPEPPAGLGVTPIERSRPHLRLVETAPAAEVEHLEDEVSDPADPKVRERRRREAWVKSLYGNLLLAEYLGEDGMAKIRSILEIENGARFVLADPRAGSVTDSGRSITASTAHADALTLVAGLAKARGWAKVKITAADPDAEAQLAAYLIEAGVEVIGYSEPAEPKRTGGPRL